MSKKITIIILCVTALIAVVGVATYIAKQRQEKKAEEVRKEEQVAKLPESAPFGLDTSDWKIYRNEKYGFEVKYPKEYQIDTTSERVAAILESPDQCSIILGDIPRGFEGASETDFKTKKDKIYINGKHEEVRIDIFNDESIFGDFSLCFANPDYPFFLITFSGSKDCLPKIKNILSTFKFIESIKIATPLDLLDTANWQLYRDLENGFEFKYPPGFIIREESLGDVKYKFLEGKIRTGIQDDCTIYNLSFEFSVSKETYNNLEEWHPTPSENFAEKSLEVFNDKINDFFVRVVKDCHLGCDVTIGLMLKNKKVFSLSGQVSDFGINPIPHEELKTQELMRQILSTLRFISLEM